MNNEITMKYELRPCITRGHKALFHGFEHRSEIVPPSPLKGGHSGGEIKGVIGIVEYEDGAIHKVNPEEIRFIDNKVKSCFEGMEQPE